MNALFCVRFHTSSYWGRKNPGLKKCFAVGARLRLSTDGYSLAHTVWPSILIQWEAIHWLILIVWEFNYSISSDMIKYGYWSWFHSANWLLDACLSQYIWMMCCAHLDRSNSILCGESDIRTWAFCSCVTGNMLFIKNHICTWHIYQPVNFIQSVDMIVSPFANRYLERQFDN